MTMQLRHVLMRNLPEEHHGRLERIQPEKGHIEPIEGGRPQPGDGWVTLPKPIRPVLPIAPDPRDQGGVGDIPEPQLPSFHEVTQELDELRRAVEAVVQADERRARYLLAEQRQENPGIVTSVTEHFSQGVPLLKQAIELALQALDMFVQNRLQPHADVPERLDREGEEMKGKSEAVSAVATKAGELKTVENWDGDAARSYTDAATVQANALTELAGVMLSSSASLRWAADFNRIAFYLVTKCFEQARYRIQALLPMVPHSRMYAATNQVAGHLRRVLEEVETTVQEAAEGDYATKLTNSLTELLDAPAVIQPMKWPTGGEAASVTPADTASVIQKGDSIALMPVLPDPKDPRLPDPVRPGLPGDPGPVRPGPVMPGPVLPGPVEPGPVEPPGPAPVMPGPVEPGPVEPPGPAPVMPGPVEPGPVQPPGPAPVQPDPPSRFVPYDPPNVGKPVQPPSTH